MNRTQRVLSLFAVNGAPRRASSHLRRIAAGLSLGFFATLIQIAPVDAAITGVASNTVQFTFSVGGVPISTSGFVPLESYPSASYYTDAAVGAGFVQMGLAYIHNDSLAKVFISNLTPVSIASQGAPAPGVGPVEIEAIFSIDFLIDAAGTPSVTVPIAYPMAVGGFLAGTADTFDAEVDYTSDALGFLGTSEVHFAFAGPGGSPFFILSGADLTLPALPALDTLTLSGSFKLVADGFPAGGSTEIEVFGIPEPSTMILAVLGGLSLVAVGLRRRR